jgi:hypothetical protein
MVETIFIHKILKQLEKYFIRKSNFRLLGSTYDLILFIPSDKYLSDAKYSLMVSSKIFNTQNQKDVIKELLIDFKEHLEFDEYNTISRINILHTEDTFVKNINFVFSYRHPVTEISNMPIGGIKIDYAFFVKSLVLDKLIENNAVVIQLSDGRTMNVGIIRMEQNFNVVLYTAKGLRDIFKTDMTIQERDRANSLKNKSEDFLIAQEFITKIPLDSIEKIL